MAWEPKHLAVARPGGGKVVCGYWLMDLRNARDEDISMVVDAVVRYCTGEVGHTRDHTWEAVPEPPEGTTAAEEESL